MNQALGAAIAIISGSGFPITQLAIARLGRTGAAAVGVITAGILTRDLALLATNRDDGDAAGPAIVLYVETAAAAVATIANLALASESGLEAASARGWRIPWVEMVRRGSLGILFAMHATRFGRYLKVEPPQA